LDAFLYFFIAFPLLSCYYILSYTDALIKGCTCTHC